MLDNIMTEFLLKHGSFLIIKYVFFWESFSSFWERLNKSWFKPALQPDQTNLLESHLWTFINIIPILDIRLKRPGLYYYFKAAILFCELRKEKLFFVFPAFNPLSIQLAQAVTKTEEQLEVEVPQSAHRFPRCLDHNGTPGCLHQHHHQVLNKDIM